MVCTRGCRENFCLLTPLYFSRGPFGMLQRIHLSAHYQLLKNFQFSPHSVLVKIECISLPLYHVENLWFTVCWNSSCYIQNESPGSSDRARTRLQPTDFSGFLVQFLFFTSTWRDFFLNRPFLFSSQVFCLWKIIFFFPSYILHETIRLRVKMLPQLCIQILIQWCEKRKKKTNKKTSLMFVVVGQCQ